MRKRKIGTKFGRSSSQRKALLRGVAASLFLHGKVRTTETRAREAGRIAEYAITTAKKKTLAARRDVARTFPAPVVRTLMGDIAERYAARSGGYTRMVKLPRRKGDRAPMAYLELI